MPQRQILGGLQIDSTVDFRDTAVGGVARFLGCSALGGFRRRDCSDDGGLHCRDPCAETDRRCLRR